ncbi:MAG: hypothetical protein H6742_06390 [Alphaproteobacteria bacterium]|nr:hypothetical protein [Alphaproteobacteria bacterium]
MRLSRLVWSPYETDADRLAERALLGQRVQVVADGADAEVLVTTSNLRVDATVLDAFPSARLVVTTTSGHDHLDLAALAARGIVAARLPLARRDAVVETTLGWMLAALHRTPQLGAQAAVGNWARKDLPALGMRNLGDTTVGIVGLGVIGRHLARLCGLLGARVLGHDPAGVPDDVEAATPRELVARCDVLSLHCSLTAASRGLVDAALLAPAEGLILLNTARGPVVDVPAALDALDAGRLSFLGLDVFPVEPWPDMAAVVGRPGLSLLPHAAGFHDGLPRLVREGLADTVDAFRSGRPLPFPLG